MLSTAGGSRYGPLNATHGLHVRVAEFERLKPNAHGPSGFWYQAVDTDHPRVRAVHVVRVGPSEDVGHAVAVDIAGSDGRESELRARAVAAQVVDAVVLLPGRRGGRGHDEDDRSDALGEVRMGSQGA